MSRNKLFAAILICFLFHAGVSGCTTTHRLANTSSEGLIASIGVNDVVQIEKRSGADIEFTVTEVSEEGIHGTGTFVPFAEIGTISVVRESRLRTGLLVASVVAVLYVLEKNADCGIIKWAEDCDDL